uniref:MFS domain-containing protein n=1 Tax=Panagrellus redivivus TaxID=6233 RepID=A0A7E4ZWG3_PANRE
MADPSVARKSRERHSKASNRRYAYVTVILTILTFASAGTFQLGFQDIFYEEYYNIFKDGARNASWYRDGPGGRFDPKVDVTLIAFHLGAATGCLMFGVSHLYMKARWGFLSAAGCALVTSALITLGDVFSSFLSLALIRTIFGACVGYMVCLQINVVDDIALDDHKVIFHMANVAAISIGYVVALLFTPPPITTATTWFIGHLISGLPLLVGFVYVVFFFKDPPAVHIFLGEDDLALESAIHYYGDANAKGALAEAHERVRVRQATPSAVTVWKDPIARKALGLSLAINIGSVFAGERCSWIILFRMMGHLTFTSPIVYSIICFVLFFGMLGMMFCTLLLYRFERKHLIIWSAGATAMMEILFGVFSATLSTWVNESIRLTGIASIKGLHHMFFYTGIGSIANFVPADLSFSGSKTILISLTFTARMIVLALWPLVYGYLFAVSPYIGSAIAAVILVAMGIYVAWRFPKLHALTPYQILQTFGFTLSLTTTPEEVQKVRSNLHRLWQNTKEE